MSEKGILINDQVGGRSVATRDATAVDDLGNPRLIQLIDHAARPAVLPSVVTGTPIRTLTLTNGAQDSDPADLATLTTQLTAVVDCSDASGVLINCFIEPPTQSDLTQYLVRVTPMVINDALDEVVGILTPIEFSQVMRDEFNAIGITKINVDPFSPIRYVPTYGFKNIGFHIVSFDPTFVSTDAVNAVSIFATPTSMGGREAILDEQTQSGYFGTGTPGFANPAA